MTQGTGTSDSVEVPLDRRLAFLLAMAMFVLVVDPSLMNVSIAAVVHDLGTHVDGGGDRRIVHVETYDVETTTTAPTTP